MACADSVEITCSAKHSHFCHPRPTDGRTVAAPAQLCHTATALARSSHTSSCCCARCPSSLPRPTRSPRSSSFVLRAASVRPSVRPPALARPSGRLPSERTLATTVPSFLPSSVLHSCLGLPSLRPCACSPQCLLACLRGVPACLLACHISFPF